MLEKVGAVTYQLNLTPSAMIHPTVHVSQLKPAYGMNVDHIPLPTEGHSRDMPEAILGRAMVKRGSRATTKVQVKWKGRTFKKLRGSLDLEGKLDA